MININLIDPKIISARRRIRRMRGWLTLIVLTMLVGTVPAGVEYARERKLRTLTTEQQSLVKQLQSGKTQLDKIDADVRTLESQIARADTLRTKRSWSRLLGNIGRLMPEQMWLESIATDPVRPRRGSLDLRPKKEKKKKTATKKPVSEESKIIRLEASEGLILEGYTQQHRHLYKFIENLKQANYFSNIELTRAAEEPVLSAKAVRFKIVCRW